MTIVTSDETSKKTALIQHYSGCVAGENDVISYGSIFRWDSKVIIHE